MHKRLKHSCLATIAALILFVSPVFPLLQDHAAADGYDPIATLDPSSLGYDDFLSYGISDNGIVGGQFSYHGVRAGPGKWQSGSFTQLSNDGGDAVVQATSPTGEIAGLYVFGHGVKWDNTGADIDLGGPSSSSSCGTDGATQADAVNDVGDIAGYCFNRNLDGNLHAGYWPGGEPNTFTDLPGVDNETTFTSWAFGINHSGNIVGISYSYDPNSVTGASWHAILWHSGTATDITPTNPDGSRAVGTPYAINDNGLIVGDVSLNTAPTNGNHAYVWDLTNNKSYDISAMTGYVAHAAAVNNSGIVVGQYNVPGEEGNLTGNAQHAFMWKAGSGFFDLNHLLAPGSDWILNSADGINSSGQIVGMGFLNGELHHYILNTTASDLPQRSYLALGDSFSSGEGAGHYVDGTDSTDPHNKCHLSTVSYPYLAAHDLGITDFHSVACSGAKVSDYSSQQVQTTANNWPLGDWEPGVKAQQAYLGQAGSTSIITISMGGNDIGFAGKLERCLTLPDDCFHFKEDREMVANEIYSQFDKLVQLYQQIKTDSGNPDNVKVYVLGYPQVFGTGSCNGFADLNVLLSSEERQAAQGLTSYFDAVIHAAADKAGVQYIDTEHALDGHRLCEYGKRAVNGFTPGTGIPGDYGVVSSGSYHPNALGQQLMNFALLAQSQDFSTDMPAAQEDEGAPYTSSSVYNNFVGDAPSADWSGLAYTSPTTLVTRAGLTGAQLVVRGTSITIHEGAEDAQAVWKAASNVSLWVQSTPTQIGTLTTDADGNLDGQVTIPDTLDPGFHILHAIGKDVNNNDVDMYQTIYVAASTDDYNGNDIPNSEDQCLIVPMSGVDSNNNGIDDACDPDLGPTPTTTASLSPTPDSNGNYTNPVTVTLSATAPTGLTVANTYYKIDGGSQQTYSDPFTISSNGSHTITYWSVDNTGLAEPQNTNTFTIQIPSSHTLFPSTTTPGTLEFPDPAADSGGVELGLKFKPTVDGQVTGVRFYKGANNTGTHIGNLWDSSGTNLASVTFTGESSSGWQEAEFSSPVDVTANTTYVISYWAPNGHYSADDWYFVNSYTNEPLVVPADSSSEHNGVYHYASDSFPSSSFGAANYYVSPVFTTSNSVPSQPDPPTRPSDATTVFSSSQTPANVVNDDQAVQLGMKFTPTANGKIYGVRFYKDSTNVGVHVGYLWDANDGTLLGSVRFDGETSSGWQEAVFDTPVDVTALHTYVVSYFAPHGDYSYTASFFTSAVDSGNLHVPDTSSASGNGVYLFGTDRTMPSNTYNANNYWVDVVYRAD